MPITTSGLLFVSFGVLITTASVLLARAHLERVERVTSGQTSSLAIALKRLPPEERIAALADRAPHGSIEQRLAGELDRTEGDAARCAAVNDLLAEIELALEASSSWPSAATRIAAYGSLMLAALAMLGGAGALAASALVVVGLAGVGFCVSFGRRAELLSRDQRKAIDALVEALVPRALLASADGARRSGTEARPRGRAR